ncbi:proline-rich region [Calothrix brevissima NIES-22]|nr:proline-rich region [Calothrix brevissima NIES-22]
MIHKASVALFNLLLILVTQSAFAQEPCLPKPNPQPNPNPESHPKPNPNPESHPKPNPNPESHPKPNPNPESHPKPNPNPESHPKPNPNPESHPKPNPNPESHPKPNPNPESNPKPNPNPESNPNPNPNPESNPKPNPNPESNPNSNPNAQPNPNNPQANPQPNPQPNPETPVETKGKNVGNLVPISIQLTGVRRVKVGHTDVSGSVFAGGGTFSSAGVEGTVSYRLSKNTFLFGQATYNPVAPSKAIGAGGVTTGVVFNAPGKSVRHNSYIGVYSNVVGFGNTGGDEVSQTAFGNVGIIGGVQRPVGEKVSVFAQAEAAQRLYSLAKTSQGQAARVSGGMAVALSCASNVSVVGDYTVGSNQSSEWGLRGVVNLDLLGGSPCEIKRISASSNVVKVTQYLVTLIGANPSAAEVRKAGLTPPNANPERYRLQSERWTGKKAQVVEKLVVDAVEVEGVSDKILFVQKPISPQALEKAQKIAADREPKQAFEEIRNLLQAEERDKTFNLEEEAKRIAQEKGMALSSLQQIGYAFTYQNRLIGVVDSDLSQPFVGTPREASPAELMIVNEIAKKGNSILPALATGYTTKGTTLGRNSVVNGNVLRPGTRVQVPKRKDVIIPTSSVESTQVEWNRIEKK